jgi:hypothetical protein
MEMLFQQKSIGWCTVYALANIFRDHQWLRFCDDEKYKGCGTDEINEMLETMGTGLKIAQVAYSNQHYRHLPKGYVYSLMRAFEEIEQGEIQIPIIPYMLTVRIIPSIYHSVAVLVCRGKMLYIDPYRQSIIEIESFEEFDPLFIDCVTVERFSVGDMFAILRGEECGYQFLLEKKVA